MCLDTLLGKASRHLLLTKYYVKEMVGWGVDSVYPSPLCLMSNPHFYRVFRGKPDMFLSNHLLRIQELPLHDRQVCPSD